MALRALILLLEFVAVTAPLTWVWLNGGRELYHAFFVSFGGALLGLFGVPMIADAPHRFIGYVPFLALVVITPGLGWRRRGLGALVGCALIFASHLVMVGVAYLARVLGARTRAELFPIEFPSLVLVDVLPFLLWVVIAREPLGRLVADLRARLAAGSEGRNGG